MRHAIGIDYEFDEPDRKYGFFDFLRDFFGMSLAYGQSVIAVSGLTIVIGMFRVTPHEFGSIIHRVIDFFSDEYYGYIIAVIALLGWVSHVDSFILFTGHKFANWNLTIWPGRNWRCH